MANTKRLLVCLLGGAISATVCIVGRQFLFGFPEINSQAVSNLVANRIIIGFAIGISGWKINHLLHGAVLGLIISVSASIAFLLTNIFGFFVYTIAGIIYGVFIEWLSTDIFKAPK